MYEEFVTVSKHYALCFLPAPKKLFLATLLRGFIRSHAQLNVRWTPDCLASLASVRVAIEGATRQCPVSATGLKSCLQSWIFHLSISWNRCSVFASPDRDRVATFPLTAPHRLTFSLTFSHSALPSWNRIPGCHCSVLLHFLFSSQSAHLCANPCRNFNGAWLELV